MDGKLCWEGVLIVLRALRVLMVIRDYSCPVMESLVEIRPSLAGRFCAQNWPRTQHQQPCVRNVCAVQCDGSDAWTSDLYVLFC